VTAPKYRWTRSAGQFHVDGTGSDLSTIGA
jgi:hypothetical protein